MIIQGDALTILKTLPDESVDCVVTSPPYFGLRDYQVNGQLGLEPNIHTYLEKLLSIFDGVKRVLKPTGTCFVNLGDSYSGSGKGGGDTGLSKERYRPELLNYKTNRGVKPSTKTGLPSKCQCCVPERFVIGMVEHGWLKRNTIIWHKINCMPQSAKDRFTNDFEYVFFFVKSSNYYFGQQFDPLSPATIADVRNETGRHTYKDSKYQDSVGDPDKPSWYRGKTFVNSEQGRNKRCVWSIPTAPCKEAHFATFPPDLIRPMILAGCPKDGTVIDIFSGAGTTGLVCKQLSRKFIGIELNPEYVKIANKRIGFNLDNWLKGEKEC